MQIIDPMQIVYDYGLRARYYDSNGSSAIILDNGQIEIIDGRFVASHNSVALSKRIRHKTVTAAIEYYLQMDFNVG